MVKKNIYRIGILVASVSRSAGGLFWAIRSLSNSLRLRADVHVYGGADEHTDADLSAWHGIPVTVSSVIGPRFFGFQFGLLNAVRHFSPDILHVHGLWMYPSLVSQVWPLSKIPRIISPHGMLDSWAVQNSGWKKKVAGAVYENRHLEHAACIHALCEQEYQAIRQYGLANPVAIIPNGVDLPDDEKKHDLPDWNDRLPENAKVLFFLSRLHPKKGLKNLLDAWAIVSNDKQSVTDYWHLVVAGWEQGGHQNELEMQAKKLGISHRVHFVGPQFNQAKESCFRRADAFVLPSFSEGLPMAVLEAWSYGLPVLMTPQCNIPEGFDARAAIKVEPEVQSLVNGLRQLFNMSDAEIEEMGKNGKVLVENRFTWDSIGKQMMDVYQWVLDKSIEKPECVYLD